MSGACIPCQAGTDCPLDMNVCVVGGYCSSPTPPGCQDGNFCNGLELVDPSDGSCLPGVVPNCDDGNVCTDDACDPVHECVHTPNTAPCSDGSACTNGDVCSGGACGAGPAIDCTDDDACTDDSCDAAAGCSNTLRAGTALVECRLAGVESVLSAAGNRISTSLKNKIAKKIRVIRTKVNASQNGKPKTATKALRAATKQVNALAKLVSKSTGKKIPADVGASLSGAISLAGSAIGGLGT